MALGTLLAASCAKEANMSGAGETPQAAITVEASVSHLTKAQTNAQGATSFEEGDKLTLYAWTGSAAEIPTQKVVNGVVNTYDGSKWTPASMMLWKNVFDAHYFLGIFPARPVISFTADPVSSSEDLLVATILGDGIVAPQTTTAPPVDLVFDHMMAKLNINVRYRNQWGARPEAVVSAQAATVGTINYVTKTVTRGEISAQYLSAISAADYAATYGSMFIPQEGVRTFTFQIDGTTLQYTHPEDLPLQPGKVTTLSLIVGKDKIELESATVSNWEEGTVDENMNKPAGTIAESTRPLTLKAVEDGTKVSFTNYSSSYVNYTTSDGQSGIVNNGGLKKTVTLNKGVRIWFVGSGSNVAFGKGENNSSLISMDKDCQVYGNVMSLLGENFAEVTTLPGGKTFSYLFKGQSHMLNHPEEGLLLPATTLTEECYRGMFQGCSSLSRVVVNATDISAQYCTRGWLDGVNAENFGLVTVDPLIWKMGYDLPWGATVYSAEGEIYTAPTALTAGLTYNTAAQKLLNAGTAHKEGVVLEYSTNGTSWSTTVPTGTNAGNYTAYCHVKGGVTSAAIAATIAAKVVTSPTITLASTSYTYDGTAKKPAVSSVKDGNNTIASSEYTVSYSNNTNAGTAKVTITDKTGGNYTVSGTKNFTINKATPTFNLSTSSVTFAASDAVDATKTVTITYNGDGTLGASSNNTSLVTVSRNNKTLTLTRKSTAAGTATITVSAAAGTNYAAASNKTISVTLVLADTGKPLKDSSYGDYVGDNGKAYSSKSDMPAGTSAMGFVIYKNGNNGFVIGPRYYLAEFISSKDDHSSWAAAAGNFYVQNLTNTEALNWVIGSKADYSKCGISDTGMGSFFTVLSNYGFGSTSDTYIYPVAEPYTIFSSQSTYNGFYTFQDTSWGIALAQAYPIIKF